MADIALISDRDLASWLGRDEPDGKMSLLVDLTNGYIVERWLNPIIPAPQTVIALAYAVAQRAYENPRGLSSWTRSWDDLTRTERLPESLTRAGIFMTPAELADLNPAQAAPSRPAARSVRVSVPGWCL